MADQEFRSTPSLFRALPSRVPLRSETKQIILNVYSKLRSKYPEETITFISSMCSDLTGVSPGTVKKLKAEAKTYDCKPISPLRSQKTPARRRLTMEDKYDDFTLSAVKRKVHQEFFVENQTPTLKKINTVLHESDILPKLCPETLRLVLKMTGIVYRRRKRNSSLIGRNDIIQWRAKYLRSIKKFRKSGMPIVYLDETWVNSGHHRSSAWQDTSIRSHESAFREGLTTGPVAPSGKGGRLILTHVGNENGFIEAAMDIFEGKKTGDYHEEMDGNKFKSWFIYKLLPNIAENSVIVMDNASYHSVKVEAIPTKSKTKAVMQLWLTSKNVEWKKEMKKKDLMALVDEERPKYDAYQIDKIAEEHGHQVLRLPPYHCELNPIELAWAMVKDFVAANNQKFTMAEVRRLLPEGIARVEKSNWERFISHVEKEEDKMIAIDGIIENEIQSFIINMDDSSDDESEASEISSIEEI